MKMKRNAAPVAAENEDINEQETELPIRNADRSARRKKSRRAIEALVDGVASDDPDSEGEILDAFAFASDDDEQERSDEEVPNTPSRTPRHGRKKKAVDAQEEENATLHLPPHERYFWDNRPGANKTSNNTLPSGILLNHDEFFGEREIYEDNHEADRLRLQEMHESAFDQWAFELKNDFNICLYGYGSKKGLMQALAEYIFNQHFEENPKAKKHEAPKIVIVNGYAPNISLMDILNSIASTILSSRVKLPATATALLELLISTLDSKKATLSSIYLLINSIDAVYLRRPNTQTALATLAAYPAIHLVATADTPNFPLLWDVSLRARFRFLFHDCTTFAPFTAEIDPVESVNQLLGRSGRGIGGRDGVGFVLRSLPENARHLFRILVAEQVAGLVDDEEGPSTRKEPATAQGMEYRMLYHKAREELVCSTEHQLRTLLKELYDHQMVESKRDALGTERLVVPFRREDLESLLEDLVE